MKHLSFSKHLGVASAIILFVTQPAQAEVASVTNIKLSTTPSGLQIILETISSKPIQVFTSSYGQTLVTDIINTQLQLPQGGKFRQDNPSTDIASVSVVPLDANSIRVTIVGVKDIPKVQVTQNTQQLVFSLAASNNSASNPDTTTEKPQISLPSENAETTTTPNETIEKPENPDIELTVTGTQDGYRVPTATTGTKIETPLRDLPLSIQVIPRQVIEDRGVVRLDELADNVAGVQNEPGYGSLPSVGFRIRGFTTNFGNLRNGFQDFGYVTPRDIANVERFEILKGPASILYGGGQFSSGIPSGVVNTVTKKPLEQPYYNASVTYGSYNYVRPTIDLTGPLTDNKSLLYRLNVAYENADSFRDFGRNDSFFIAPALTWKIGERTTLGLEFEYQNYNLNFNYGFLPEPEFLKLPRNRFLGEPKFSESNNRSTSFTYNLEHEFSDRWKFRQGFNIVQANLDTKSTFLYALQGDRRTGERGLTKSDEANNNLTLQNEIYGKFNTGSIRHNLLFGVEVSRYKFEYDFTDGDVNTIDIFNPQYRNSFVIPSSPTSGREYGSENVALYLQNLIEVLPNLKILAGGRFDYNELFRKNRVTNTTINEQSNSQFSPRVGIVYQPSQLTSLYFNWAKSFTPNITARSRTDEQFEPETGEQFEVGIKQDLIKDRLSATLALYQITRQNVLTSDPINPNYRIPTGEQRSRGVELDITGQILPGWKIIANYAYNDAVVTEDEDIPIGDKLYGVPRNSASLWTTYQIQSGNLQGLGFGLGLAFVGEQEARVPNNLTLPSYVRADAAIFGSNAIATELD